MSLTLLKWSPTKKKSVAQAVVPEPEVLILEFKNTLVKVEVST